MSLQLPTGIEQRLVRHRLARCTATLQELREDLRITREQHDIMRDDAADSALRAIVAETPSAEFEHRDTQRHFVAISGHLAHLELAIAHHESEIDSLLDRLHSTEATEPGESSQRHES
jgi:chromosome segregation ATPase